MGDKGLRRDLFKMITDSIGILMKPEEVSMDSWFDEACESYGGEVVVRDGKLWCIVKDYRAVLNRDVEDINIYRKPNGYCITVTVKGEENVFPTTEEMVKWLVHKAICLLRSKNDDEYLRCMEVKLEDLVKV